jgi:hypothetical protein
MLCDQFLNLCYGDGGGEEEGKRGEDRRYGRDVSTLLHVKKTKALRGRGLMMRKKGRDT